MHRDLLSLAVCLSATAWAQGQTTAAAAATAPNKLQCAGFNSTFTLSRAQIEAAGLSASTAADVEAAVRFDRSQLANGGTSEDAFYELPPLPNNGPRPAPGTLLRVQAHTDPGPFALPPNTAALSRILYATRDLNGTAQPASAYVLWPFAPRTFPPTASSSSNPNSSSPSDGKAKAEGSSQARAPTVLWSHGTSGFFGPQAPSAHRALWYGEAGPFALARDGYAVVAADYAGLGVSRSWDGATTTTTTTTTATATTTTVAHQCLASRAGAPDGLYALRAARAAFPGALTDEFVALGHSQGGGVTWAVAEVLAAAAAASGEGKGKGKGKGEGEGEFADLLRGYRGGVAGSPTTDLFAGAAPLVAPLVALGLGGVFAGFEPERDGWLTALGARRLRLLREVGGGVAVAQKLFPSHTPGAGAAPMTIRPSYNETWQAAAYAALANAGRRAFAGPLLVVQGTADPYIPFDVTSATVRDACAAVLRQETETETETEGEGGRGQGSADLECLVVNGTGHVPTLDAARRVWLAWIRARFAAEPLRSPGCGVTTHLASFLPLARYAAAGTSYPQWAGAPEYAFEIPLAV